MNNYILQILEDIMAIDSPSGYTKNVITYCEKEAHQLGFQTKRTNKGNLEIFVDGKDDYTVGFCAHVDTLGLMVRSIRNDGTLAFTNVGGPLVPTLDGEYCKIITREQQIYTGTILSNSPAVHVFKDAKSLERSCDTMHIRIDEIVKSLYLSNTFFKIYYLNLSKSLEIFKFILYTLLINLKITYLFRPSPKG